MAQSIDQQAKALEAEIKRRIKAGTEAARLEAHNQAGDVAAVMQTLAPKDEWELANSIRAQDLQTLNVRGVQRNYVGAAVLAGDETTIVTNSRGQKFQNARLQEFGTKARPASPFFFPTWRGMKSRVRSAITRKFRQAFTR